MADHFHHGAIRTGPGSFIGKLAFDIIPVQVRDVAISFLIGIGFAIVVVKQEVAICAWIDTNLCNILFLLSIFNLFAQREDRPGANEERYRIDWGTDANGLSALVSFVRPKVVPFGAGG